MNSDEHIGTLTKDEEKNIAFIETQLTKGVEEMYCGNCTTPVQDQYLEKSCKKCDYVFEIPKTQPYSYLMNNMH